MRTQMRTRLVRLHLRDWPLWQRRHQLVQLHLHAYAYVNLVLARSRVEAASHLQLACCAAEDCIACGFRVDIQSKDVGGHAIVVRRMERREPRPLKSSI